MTAVTGDKPGRLVEGSAGDTVCRVAYEVECRWPNLLQTGRLAPNSAMTPGYGPPKVYGIIRQHCVRRAVREARD